MKLLIKCPHCDKEYTKYGLNAHIWRAHTEQGMNLKPHKGHTAWNKGLTKETSPSVKINSEKLKGRNFGWRKGFGHDDDTKAKISKSMRGNSNANHRGDRQSYYAGIRMDSGWETKVAKYFDNNNIEWKYAPTVFVIDEHRSYKPDFLINGDTYIEVKGYWRKNNLQKFNDWKIKYPTILIEVWDKTKLKNLNII